MEPSTWTPDTDDISLVIFTELTPEFGWVGNTLERFSDRASEIACREVEKQMAAAGLVRAKVADVSLSARYEAKSMSAKPEWLEMHGREVAEVTAMFLLGGDTEMAELVASRFNAIIAHAKELRDNGSPAKV